MSQQQIRRIALAVAGVDEPEADVPLAISTAYQWHQGAGSGMYAFASNGGSLADESQRQRLLDEVEQAQAWVSTNRGAIDSGKFPEYADDAQAAQEAQITTSEHILGILDNLKEAAQTADVLESKQASRQAAGEFHPTEAHKVLKNYIDHSVDLQDLKEGLTASLADNQDPDEAWRVWLFFVNSGAKAYTHEFGGVWFSRFPNAVREAIAKEIAGEGSDQEAPTPMNEHPASDEDASIVMSSVDKEAKVVVSEDVFQKAIQTVQAIVNQLNGQNSPEEGKAVKLLHELQQFETRCGGNLAHALDDETNPEGAKWVRNLVSAVSALRNEIEGNSHVNHNHPSNPLVPGMVAPVEPLRVSSAVTAAVGVEADFVGDTIRSIVNYVRVNQQKLKDVLRDQGPEAIQQMLATQPGGQLSGKVAPYVSAWLQGTTNDAALVGQIEAVAGKRASEEQVQLIATQELKKAGFTGVGVTASVNNVTLHGLKTNAHTLKFTRSLANTYGFKVKLSAEYQESGLQPATYPEPEQDYPQEIIQEGDVVSAEAVEPSKFAASVVLDGDSGATTVTASDDSLIGVFNELKATLSSARELADQAIARARLTENDDLIMQIERVNTKVFEALLAARGAKAEIQDGGMSTREDRAVGLVAAVVTASELPNGIMSGNVDNKADALKYIHGNADRFEDLTVQQMRDALSEAGFSGHVSEAAVSELLGHDAMLALGAPVADFL